jgi:hypothetical protein
LDWVLLYEITLSAKTTNFYVNFTKILDNSIGHGSFLLSNNNYSWSHAFTANNLQASTFSFAEGNLSIYLRGHHKDLGQLNLANLYKRISTKQSLHTADFIKLKLMERSLLLCEFMFSWRLCNNSLIIVIICYGTGLI